MLHLQQVKTIFLSFTEKTVTTTYIETGELVMYDHGDYRKPDGL